MSEEQDTFFFSPESTREPMLQIVNLVVSFFEMHFQTETLHFELCNLSWRLYQAELKLVFQA